MRSENNEALYRAKRPLTPLAGPYGHPFHPLLVTVPIGAWTSSLVFDYLAGTGQDDRAYSIGAKRLIDIGIVAAAGAAVLGFIDFLQIQRGSKAWYAGLMHLGLNVGALGLFAANSADRGRHLKKNGDGPAVTRQQKSMSIASAMALMASGWIGGVLVYHYGVRVVEDDVQQQTGFRLPQSN
jgi:uncharacterized membrane protein